MHHLSNQCSIGAALLFFTKLRRYSVSAGAHLLKGQTHYHMVIWYINGVLMDKGPKES